MNKIFISRTILILNNIVLDILKTLDLYSDKTGYNRAAELLVDKNTYPGLDIVRFGDNINAFLDREIIEGLSLIDQYNKSIDIFNKYYKYEVIDGKDRIEISSPGGLPTGISEEEYLI